MKINEISKIEIPKIEIKPLKVKKIIKVYRNNQVVLQIERKGTLFDTYG